jgi:signal transduction histidine kinase
MESVPTPATGADISLVPAIASLFDSDLELETIERMLLAFAVHPHGGGCDRAWVLVWDGANGRMAGWREAEAPAGHARLAAALAAARIARAETRDPAVRAWAEPPEMLASPLAEAWQGATLALAAAPPHAGPWAGAPAVAALALKRGSRAYGLLVGAWSDVAANASRREQLETLRVLADAALGAQARGAEAKRRARQAEALAGFARTGVSAVNLAEALHLLARAAVQAAPGGGAAFYRAAEGGLPRVEIAYGPTASREPVAEAFAPLAAGVMASGQPGTGGAGADATGVPEGIASEVSAWAVHPVVAYGRPLGALLAWDGAGRHPSAVGFEGETAAFLATLADVAALLLEHARVLDVLRHNERQRGDLLSRAQATEHLAAVGELAERIARESRNPIASISAFARRAQRELPEDDPHHEYLEIVVRETERLDAMLREQLEYAQAGGGKLRMQALNTVVQEALQRSSETLVRRRVRLLRKLAADLPDLLLDAKRIRRVIENIVAFALESVPVGGRIQVQSRRVGDHVAVEISHDGTRTAGDLLEQLFVPFATGAQGGAAIGLGVAQQIVREHGGEVRVRGEGEWGTVFSFTLPIAGNEDRRQSHDRRTVRGERRARGGEAQGSGGGSV